MTDSAKIKNGHCRHEILRFNSGAYYVVCDICGATWKPENENEMYTRCVSNIASSVTRVSPDAE